MFECPNCGLKEEFDRLPQECPRCCIQIPDRHDLCEHIQAVLDFMKFNGIEVSPGQHAESGESYACDECRTRWERE